ncbi:hypothetical protein L7F22_063125 [Adiantum nelumboides]|nr:hypothetical protein [Adiantum nelumboides]
MNGRSPVNWMDARDIARLKERKIKYQLQQREVDQEEEGMVLVPLTNAPTAHQEQGCSLEEATRNTFPYWARSLARQFWEVHGRDGQSLGLQQSLDYSGMHQVFDGEDSDDTVEDLDGASDYLSDKREKEELNGLRKELKNAVAGVDIAGGLQALVKIAQRAEKRFGVSHGKAAKRSSKDKKKSRSKRKKRSDDLDSDTDTDLEIDTISDLKTDFDVEFFEIALVEVSQEIGIRNLCHGKAIKIWTAESEVQKEERWRNVLEKKDLEEPDSKVNFFSVGSEFKKSESKGKKITLFPMGIVGSVGKSVPKSLLAKEGSSASHGTMGIFSVEEATNYLTDLSKFLQSQDEEKSDKEKLQKEVARLTAEVDEQFKELDEKVAAVTTKNVLLINRVSPLAEMEKIENERLVVEMKEMRNNRKEIEDSISKLKAELSKGLLKPDRNLAAKAESDVENQADADFVMEKVVEIDAKGDIAEQTT